MSDYDKLVEALERIVAVGDGRHTSFQIGAAIEAVSLDALRLARQLIEDLDKLRESRDAFADDNLKLRDELRTVHDALHSYVKDNTTLQSRLVAAEERIEAHAKAGDAVRRKLKRAEAVVEAAKRGCERDPLHQCPNCRPMTEAIRQYEEGR